MRNQYFTPAVRQAPSSFLAFTLIELLVVIAVIAIMAALIFPTTIVLKKKRIIAVAQAELAQVETAIDAYKSHFGNYPPDNPGNPLINQLYFELKGTIRASNGDYKTLDGSGQILTGQFGLTTFGSKVDGFVNSSASAKGSDDTKVVVNFLKDLKPAQSGPIDTVTPLVKLLACSVKWDKAPYPIPNSPELIPWQYVSTHPANNPSSFDLWVDLSIGGKIYRISNWSKQPQ